MAPPYFIGNSLDLAKALKYFLGRFILFIIFLVALKGRENTFMSKMCHKLKKGGCRLKTYIK
jgi:hypothetical protein